MSDNEKEDKYPTPNLKRRGLMLILSSPPGGGKTTISHAIRELDKETLISVSATTRDKRPGEIEGEHYYFVEPDEFQQLVDEDKMLEYAKVYNGHMYGTLRQKVEDALAVGRDVIFDIDWQGMRQLKEKVPEDIVSVFILPPAWEALRERLNDRARDSEDDIEHRLENALSEILHYTEFQYVIINKDLDESVKRVYDILESERLKRTRLTGLEEFVTSLKPSK